MKTRSIEIRLISFALSLFMALMLLPDIGARVYAEVGDVIPESDYLTFTAERGSVLYINIAQGSLQYKYSISNGAWWDYTSGTPIGLKTGQTVSFRGKNVTFSYDNHVDINGKFACSGNIMSLRMNDEGKDQGLSPGCFSYMFKGCTGLTSAPSLPATTLADSCYSDMFYGCTGLTSAPTLPATTLADSCYSDMFYGCTGLKSAPELPATTLARDCYTNMFSGCTGLTLTPELPATTLAQSCYYGMFSDCTGLTSAPELPAATLADYCYFIMFDGCTGICISETQIDGYNYEYRIPSSGEGTTAKSALNGMFSDTGGTFTGTPDINKTYYMKKTAFSKKTDYLTFTAGQDGSSVKMNIDQGSLWYSKGNDLWRIYTVNSDIPLNNGESVRFCGKDVKFSNDNHVSITGKVACSGNIMSLRINDECKDQGLSDSCFSYIFKDCTGLTSAPELPATTLAENCYRCMFYRCTGLTSAPELPATTLAQSCYYYMFYRCTGLTSAPELPATALAESCYSYMFSGCTGLTSAPKLPATILAESCYSYMFKGCTGLTSAPELPATTLTNDCYSYMFVQCTGICISETQTDEYNHEYRVPSSGEGTIADDALYCMFSKTGGTFTGSPDINKTYYMHISQTVTFNTNGHGTAPENQIVSAGGLVVYPTSPEETGWRFIGWYKDEDCKTAWDFENDTVTDALTLYAKWLKLGDVDLDGYITDKDAAMVLKYIATEKLFFEDDLDKTVYAMMAANIDGENGIDMLDVIKILSIADSATAEIGSQS